MTDMHNFLLAKQNAIEQMLDMNKKALQSGVTPQQNTTQNTHKPHTELHNNFGVTLSNDDIIIIGLILILSTDCRDMWLFLALVYILM